MIKYVRTPLDLVPLRISFVSFLSTFNSNSRAAIELFISLQGEAG